jgi:hypothetical protein
MPNGLPKKKKKNGKMFVSFRHKKEKRNILIYDNNK